MSEMNSGLSHIQCPQCGKEHSPDSVVTYCQCGSPLFAVYDTGRVAELFSRGEFPTHKRSMWRYGALLPVRSPQYVVSLGEGWTPLLRMERLGRHIGLQGLRVKDEGRNPTASFKDRGMSASVSKHLELGREHFVLPSAGNAAVSLSAYCAYAGVHATVFMPEDTPSPFVSECKMYGAEVVLVTGTISNCGAQLRRQAREGWTPLSTTKEPYRVEGKKTIIFEIAEQLGWRLPAAVVCPTGGGTAIVAAHKALQELRAIGAVEDPGTRLYAVQTEACSPIVEAYNNGTDDVAACHRPGLTTAYGLRVPQPFAGRLILRALRDTGGRAVAVPERDIEEMRSAVGRLGGLNICPESAAGLTGLRALVEAGDIDPSEEVVVLNTASAARYL